MDLNEYQKRANETAVHENPDTMSELVYLALGLAGEAGEVADVIKKVMRDDKVRDPSPERKQQIVHELGDVLWYLSQLAEPLGVTLEDIAQANLEKLASRKARGTLHGAGADR